MSDPCAPGQEPSRAPLIDRLASWLARRRPLLLASLAPGVSAEVLSRASRAVGSELPPELRELYAWRDGELEFYGLQGPWVWLPLERALAERATMQALRASEEAAGSEWPDGALPFLEDGAGSFICLDLRGNQQRSAGEVLHYDHETRSVMRLHASFTKWLETLCEALEAGLYPVVDDDPDASREPTDVPALDALHARQNPGYPRP